MKRNFALFAMVMIASVSLINCGEDEVTNPEDNHNPTVSITSPADDDSFAEGEMISFAGEGEDYKSGALPDSMLVWTSNHDDTIGTGISFGRDDLSVNTHVITLTGTDSDGNADSDNITIHVTSGSGPGEYDLLRVPVGIGYSMGWEGIAANEAPVHTVSLDEFRIGKYEVTYALWTEVRTWAESNGYTFANAGQQGGCTGGPCSNTDQHPVTYINWRDCIAWCNAYSEKEALTPVYFTSSSKTVIYRNSSTGRDIGNDFVDWAGDGFRLPTEAEWEYAARYIDIIHFSSGAEHSGYNLDPDIGDCAWYEDNTGTSTHPVGQLQANSLGAYDMSGQVWEWCWDQFGAYPSSLQDNPRGPDVDVSEPYIYRVHRGGGWYNSPAYCRSASRDFSGRGSASEEIYTGFRVARSGSAN
jgi:formylglycine-generating enzyme required for sulfatase activity